MIEGQVNSSLEPIIQLALCGSDRDTSISAIVDTGLGGHVCPSSDSLVGASLMKPRKLTIDYAEATVRIE